MRLQVTYIFIIMQLKILKTKKIIPFFIIISDI